MTEMYQNIKNKFPYLPDAKLEALLSEAEMLVLEEGEVFVRTGEKSGKVGFVIEGLMRNYTINDNGEEVTVMFAVEMGTITPYRTLLGLAASETCAAVERSIILVMDLPEFKRRALEDPILMRVYVQVIEESLVAAVQRIEDFTQKKPEQRYQRVLDKQAFLIDRVPLKYLASYLGITAVSLSRIRKRLSSQGRS